MKIPFLAAISDFSRRLAIKRLNQQLRQALEGGSDEAMLRSLHRHPISLAAKSCAPISHYGNPQPSPQREFDADIQAGGLMANALRHGADPALWRAARAKLGAAERHIQSIITDLPPSAFQALCQAGAILDSDIPTRLINFGNDVAAADYQRIAIRKAWIRDDVLAIREAGLRCPADSAQNLCSHLHCIGAEALSIVLDSNILPTLPPGSIDAIELDLQKQVAYFEAPLARRWSGSGMDGIGERAERLLHHLRVESCRIEIAQACGDLAPTPAPSSKRRL